MKAPKQLVPARLSWLGKQKKSDLSELGWGVGWGTATNEVLSLIFLDNLIRPLEAPV